MTLIETLRRSFKAHQVQKPLRTTANQNFSGDVGIDRAFPLPHMPPFPPYLLHLMLLELQGDVHSCRIVQDRVSGDPETRIRVYSEKDGRIELGRVLPDLVQQGVSSP